CEEITERQHERERRAGKQAGNGKRKNDTQERGAAIGAQVLRGFDQRAGNMLQRRIDGKKNKRRIDVRKHQDHGEGTVEKEADRFARDVQILQQAVKHAVAAKNGLPGVAANKIADPQRYDHQLIQKFLARTCVERKIVGKRVAEKEGAKSHRSGDARSAQENLNVKRIAEQRAIVLKIPLMHKRAIANKPETVREHECVRQQKKKADPQ